MYNKIWRLCSKTIHTRRTPKVKDCIDVEYFMYIWWKNHIN